MMGWCGRLLLVKAVTRQVMLRFCYCWQCKGAWYALQEFM